VVLARLSVALSRDVPLWRGKRASADDRFLSAGSFSADESFGDNAPARAGLPCAGRSCRTARLSLAREVLRPLSRKEAPLGPLGAHRTSSWSKLATAVLDRGVAIARRDRVEGRRVEECELRRERRRRSPRPPVREPPPEELPEGPEPGIVPDYPPPEEEPQPAVIPDQPHEPLPAEDPLPVGPEPNPEPAQPPGEDPVPA